MNEKKIKTTFNDLFINIYSTEIKNKSIVSQSMNKCMNGCNLQVVWLYLSFSLGTPAF